MERTLETTVGELAEKFDQFMHILDFSGKQIPAHGFTIGKGKQLHWYISPSAKTSKYACYPTYQNSKVPGNIELGSPRYIYPETKVTIHYNDNF